MSKLQTPRGFINQRLSAAAEEIFELFERTIAAYEEQLCRSKEDQQKLLEAVYNPVRLHRADIQQLLVSSVHATCEQKERGLSLDQEDSTGPPLIKEEQEELWSHQEMGIHGLKEQETAEFLLTVPAKTEEEEEEEEEDLESSQLLEKQTEEMLPSESETDDSSYYLEELTPVSFSECATNPCKKEPEKDSRKIQNNVKTFSCSVCGKSFKKKANLLKHQQTHKGDDGRMSGLNQLQKEEAPVSDVKFDSGKNLESSSECASSAEQKPEPQNLNETQKEDKPFACSVCKGRFTTKDHLTRHMDCHSSEKPFCCSVCGRTFLRKSYLKQHMIYHSGEKPYSCSQCGKKFLRPSRLREHAANHTGEKLFCCTVCGKSFFQMRYLKQHMFCHSGEKPHSCSYCGKRFLKPSKLREHEVRHTGKKPFHCNICDKSFTRGDLFKKHACDAESSRKK